VPSIYGRFRAQCLLPYRPLSPQP